MADKATVTVSISVDLEEAERLGKYRLATSFLAQFQAQGGDWQRAIKADPLLQRILQVEVSCNQ